MAQIRITPEELKSKAVEVRGYRGEYDALIKKMQSLVLGLSEIWEGEAQKAFQTKFESMQQQFTNFGDMLDSYASLMDTAADQMQQTDTSLGSTIQSSFN